MPVYDDQDTKPIYDTEGGHDNLGVHPEHAEAEAADLERQFAAPSAEGRQPSSSRSTNSPDDLRDKEESGGIEAGQESNGSDEQDKLGRGFTGKKEQKKTPRGKLSKKTKTRLLAGAAGGVSAIGLIIVLGILFLGSLGIPNFMQNVTQYAFVRYTRQLSKSSSRIVQEAVASQASQGVVRQALEEKFGKSLERFDNFRPQKVLENLGTSNGMEIHAEAKFGRGNVVTRLVVDGQELPIQRASIKDALSLKNYINNAKNETIFLRAVDQNMKLGDINFITRSAALRQLKSEIGASTAGWILSKFKGLSPSAAQAEAVAQEIAATRGVKPSNAVTASVAEAENAAAQAEQEVAKDPKKIGAAIAEDGVAIEVEQAVERSVGGSFVTGAIETLNTAYAIAVPVCIIYDGSMIKAGPSIDTQSERVQRQYYDVAAKADQQKYGARDGADPTQLATAIAATNAQLGDTVNSNAMLVVSGKKPNEVQSVQANAMGSYDYTIFNAMGLDNSGVVGKILNTVMTDGCKTMTDLRTAAGLAAVNVIITAVTGGTSKAAEGTIKVAATKAIQSIVSRTVEKALAKKVMKEGLSMVTRNGISRLGRLVIGPSFKKFAAKQGAIVGATFGVTELAKLVVFNSSGQMTSGMAQKDDFANNIFQGGLVAGNEASRKTSYGAPLTDADLVASSRQDAVFLANLQSSKSYYNRYFSPKDANSLLARVAVNLRMNIKPSFVDSLIRAASLILNPIKSVASTFGNMNPLVHAADTVTNNGVVNFGWTAAEEALIDKDLSYGMLANEKTLADSGKESEVSSTYGRCFTDSIGTLLAEGLVKRDENGAVKDDDSLCSPKNLGFKNPKYGDLVFRLRIKSRYDKDFGRLKDLSLPPQARAATTAQTGASGTGMGASDLPAGSAQELAKQILASPNVVYTSGLSISAAGLRAAMQEIADTGSQSGCGGVAVNPRLLSTILALSKTYKITIGVIVSGHGCTDASHSKGLAVDINGVNGTNIGGSTFNEQTVRDLYLDAAKLLQAGGGGHLNQAQCFSAGNPAASTTIKEALPGDACTHIHMDVRT